MCPVAPPSARRSCRPAWLPGPVRDFAPADFRHRSPGPDSASENIDNCAMLQQKVDCLLVTKKRGRVKRRKARLIRLIDRFRVLSDRFLHGLHVVAGHKLVHARGLLLGQGIARGSARRAERRSFDSECTGEDGLRPSRGPVASRAPTAMICIARHPYQVCARPASLKRPDCYSGADRDPN